MVVGMGVEGPVGHRDVGLHLVEPGRYCPQGRLVGDELLVGIGEELRCCTEDFAGGGRLLPPDLGLQSSKEPPVTPEGRAKPEARMTSWPGRVSGAISPPAPDTGSAGRPSKMMTFSVWSAWAAPSANASGVKEIARAIEAITSEMTRVLRWETSPESPNRSMARIDGESVGSSGLSQPCPAAQEIVACGAG